MRVNKTISMDHMTWERLQVLRNAEGARGVGELIDMMLNYWSDNTARRAADAALAKPRDEWAPHRQAEIV